MDVEDFHKQPQTINGGVDTTVVASIDESGAAAVSIASAGPYEQNWQSERAGIMPAFAVYWDQTSSSYKVNAPLVYGGDGEEIAVTPATLSNGTWYCAVKTGAGGQYAEIVNALDDDAIVNVKICTISGTTVTQHHVGAVTIGVGSFIGDEGLSGGDAETIRGEAVARGSSGSGLVVKTGYALDTPTMAVDLAGRSSSDAFGVKNVLDGNEQPIGKVFSTVDIKLAASGDKDVEVITGLQFYMDGNKLMMKLNKKKLKGVTFEDVEDEPEEALIGTNTTVLTGATYDTSTQKFTVQRCSIYALGEDPAEDEEVFNAIRHQ